MGASSLVGSWMRDGELAPMGRSYRQVAEEHRGQGPLLRHIGKDHELYA